MPAQAILPGKLQSQSFSALNVLFPTNFLGFSIGWEWKKPAKRGVSKNPNRGSKPQSWTARSGRVSRVPTQNHSLITALTERTQTNFGLASYLALTGIFIIMTFLIDTLHVTCKFLASDTRISRRALVVHTAQASYRIALRTFRTTLGTSFRSHNLFQ